jgi:hypothetical protein
VILHQRSTTHELPSKLSPNFLGPFKVITHIQNDVTCKNLITDALSVFHTSRLKLFTGTFDVAYEHALRDADQYVIKCITAYRGDPFLRTSMQFETTFNDNTTLWLPWSPDISVRQIMISMTV